MLTDLPRKVAEAPLCRCEEVSISEIKEAISCGITTLNGIKRVTRAGMGLCQGQTCQRLITALLAQETGCSPAEIESSTVRPPVRPVSMDVLARDGLKKWE